MLVGRWGSTFIQINGPRGVPNPRLPAALWTGWRSALVIVKPETVIAWHRRGFRLYGTWKSRHARPGRPEIPLEVRDLIGKMSLANPLWGAPRLHGELRKLGLELSQATVAKYMPRRGKLPSQRWRAFLSNHLKQLVSTNFLVVPTWRCAPEYS